jgi:hypothetical protein
MENIGFNDAKSATWDSNYRTENLELYHLILPNGYILFRPYKVSRKSAFSIPFGYQRSSAQLAASVHNHISVYFRLNYFKHHCMGEVRGGGHKYGRVVKEGRAKGYKYGGYAYGEG